MPLTGNSRVTIRSSQVFALLLCITAAANPLRAQAPAAATTAVVFNATTRPLSVERGGSKSSVLPGAGLSIPLDVQITSGAASWAVEDARSLCSPVGGMGDGAPLGRVVTARSPRGWHQDSCVPDAAFRCIGVGIDDHGIKLVRIASLDCMVLAISDSDFVETAVAQIRDSLQTGPRLP